MSYDTSYGLGYAADTYGDNTTTVDSKYVVGLAAKSLGWRNHYGDIVRVKTSVGTGWDWTVWVDRALAEEFGREVWKDGRTRNVFINGTPFPKPTVADVEKEFEAFKKKVFEVALAAKRNNDWCNDGFKAAMAELGIEIPTTKVRVVLELDFADHDVDVDVKNVASVKSALKWDIDQSDLGDAVVSVEPINN